MVAFLWDAWGKQDLFVVTPGQSAGRADRLSGRSRHPDVSDINSFTWLSPNEILFSQGRRLVDGRADGRRKAGALRRRARRCGQLHAVARSQADRVHARRPDLDRVAEGQDAASGHRSGADDRAGNPVFSFDGEWLAFTSTAAACRPIRGLLPFNGDRDARRRQRQRRRRRRRGRAPARRGLRVRAATSPGFPIVGNAELRPIHRRRRAGLDRGIGRTARRARSRRGAPGAPPRTLWKDRDERWFSPTGRDSKVLVSPDGKSVAFISDRSGWIHIYVMPVDATSESQAKQLTTGGYLRRAWQLVARQHAHRVSPQRGRQSDASASSTSSTCAPARASRSSPRAASTTIRRSRLTARTLVFHRTDIENSLDLYTVPARAAVDVRPARATRCPPG